MVQAVNYIVFRQMLPVCLSGWYLKRKKTKGQLNFFNPLDLIRNFETKIPNQK